MSRRPGTRAAHATFCLREGWSEARRATGKQVAHHRTYELPLADGRVLRTRISRPVDATDYGASLWQHILRDQLEVGEDEFWLCVDEGQVPDRGQAPTPPQSALPAWLVVKLTAELHLTGDQIAELTREEGQALLEAHWSSPPSEDDAADSEDA